MATTEQLNTALAGRYAIERLVGEGGMATVYLARDLKHDRKVALQVLKPKLGAVLGVEHGHESHVGRLVERPTRMVG